MQDYFKRKYDGDFFTGADRQKMIERRIFNSFITNIKGVRISPSLARDIMIELLVHVDHQDACILVDDMNRRLSNIRIYNDEYTGRYMYFDPPYEKISKYKKYNSKQKEDFLSKKEMEL